MGNYILNKIEPLEGCIEGLRPAANLTEVLLLFRVIVAIHPELRDKTIALFTRYYGYLKSPSRHPS